MSNNNFLDRSLSVFKKLSKRQVGHGKPQAGMIYHYLRQDHQSKTRIHLRMEEDDRGLLLVNASRVYHFNQTAAYLAYLMLEEISPAQIIQELTHCYHVNKAQAIEDFDLFQKQFSAIISPEEICPICDLELETTAPFSSRPSAPYRMDLAVTYRCQNSCLHCYNARPRNYPELSTDQWKNIIDQLWKIGIPHIVFTGGEPTLRNDLPELIAHAEKNGQITGINTNGRRLQDQQYLEQLVSAGLDHVQVTLESYDAHIHDQMVHASGAWQETMAGIKNALSTSLFVMTNTTLLTSNSHQLESTLKFLGELGVPTVGLNALIHAGHGLNINSGLPESDLIPLLNIAKQLTTQQNQRLIWYTPTQYCNFNPIDMELGVKGCTAALYNMCIEPDGSVIPCQSYYQSLGNITQTPWEKIWNHDLAISLRERRHIPSKCHICSYLPECGGGCPLARQVQEHVEV